MERAEHAIKSGYKTAIDNATAILATLDPQAVCARTGAIWSDGEYMIPWFGENRPLSSGGDAEQILWLHYLISEGTGLPTSRLVAYRELKGAGFYEPAFNARAVRPLVKRFGSNPSALLEAGKVLGGTPSDVGDFSVTLYPLPYVPVTYAVWTGDDELPPGGNVLFDETASGWLHAEDLVVLASLGSYALIKEGKS